MKKVILLMLVFLLACSGASRAAKVLEAENWQEKRHLDYQLYPKENLVIYAVVYKGYGEKDEARRELMDKAEFYQGEAVKKIFSEQMESLKMDERKENISAWNEIVNEVKGYALEKYNEELEGYVKKFKERKWNFLSQEEKAWGYQKIKESGKAMPLLVQYIEYAFSYKDYAKLRDDFLLEQIKSAPESRSKLFRQKIYEEGKGL